MSVIGEAALSVFLELLGGKLLDSALNFVADHKQLHPQLKQWQSMLPDIQAVLDNAEEKQIKNEGVKKWLEDLQDLAYDVDDILDEFAYEELRLQLQKTQAQASTSKALKAKLAKNIGEIQLICFSLFDLVKRINGGIQYTLQHGIRELNLTHVRKQSSQNIVLSNLKDVHLSFPNFLDHEYCG
ncbi:putative disease resistance RPP13-like protein 1 isoform X2 [Gossypium hirsutum]|uniref:Disease resistance RPP13-like protein 1 isoform X2 n=1 Tax=Gossypium hirsutum TaxID=3635 RepID=A0ABM2Z0C4_GOSHI|nr:putative disease resistance RPP13-like protein 1 isoform X2 [Gossypium hirsutum]